MAGVTDIDQLKADAKKVIKKIQRGYDAVAKKTKPEKFFINPRDISVKDQKRGR